MADTILADHERLKGNAALAALPAADRLSDQPDLPLADQELDAGDTTSILHGAALLGKASWSAGRMNDSTFALYAQARSEQTLRDEEEAREIEHLMAWNAQMVMVGGVEMTNEEAQDARGRVIENDEAYADWAVRRGLINADEKDDFKAGIRRKKELEDRRGRGIITPAEEREEAALDRSRAGKAVDAATGYDYQQRGVAPRPSPGPTLTNADVRGAAAPSALDDYALFQAAPPRPAGRAADQPAPALSATVTSSGLAL